MGCPTFGRVQHGKHLLEETIHSFLRQDYAGEKELIICNDHAGQILRFEHPEVRVINLSARFPTLGEKYNFIFSQATGSVFATAEDDDVFLSNHISMGVAKLGDAPAWNPGGYWFLDSRGLHHEFSVGVCHNCSFFTKDAFNKVGGYPPVTGNQDAAMNGLLMGLPGAIRARLIPRERTYLYRFGVSNLHLSAFSDMQKVYDDYANHVQKTGTFKLHPHWRNDYAAMVKKYMADNKLAE